jgi:hypothetical protein
MSVTSVAFASGTSEAPTIAAVQYVINGERVSPDGEYRTLAYNGHLYVPIRWLAERTGANVDYDDSSATVKLSTLQNERIYGPTVTPDQAKLVAFESYRFKHVDDNVELRALSDAERKQIPPDPDDLTPVYYVVTGTDADDKKAAVYVSSNKKEHHFQYDSSLVDLAAVQDRLFKLDDVYRRSSVKLMGAYRNNGTVVIMVRKLNDHHIGLTEEETSELKQAIYAAVGATFPLDITSMKLDEHGDISGVIKAIDKEKQRVLIENPDNILSSGKPDAIWFTFAPDAVIAGADGTTGLTFADLRTGQRAEAWSNGFIADSYPAQATALELKLLPD